MGQQGCKDRGMEGCEDVEVLRNLVRGSGLEKNGSEPRRDAPRSEGP